MLLYTVAVDLPGLGRSLLLPGLQYIISPFLCTKQTARIYLCFTKKNASYLHRWDRCGGVKNVGGCAKYKYKTMTTSLFSGLDYLKYTFLNVVN